MIGAHQHAARKLFAHQAFVPRCGETCEHRLFPVTQPKYQIAACESSLDGIEQKVADDVPNFNGPRAVVACDSRTCERNRDAHLVKGKRLGQEHDVLALHP